MQSIHESKRVPRGPYIPSNTNELRYYILQLEGRQRVFAASRSGNIKDLKSARSFYIEHAHELVPEHDYTAIVQIARNKHKKIPKKNAFFRKRAKHIFNNDKEVSLAFAEEEREWLQTLRERLELMSPFL